MKFRLFSVLMLMALVNPVPAIAHDQLIDQSPDAGSVLEAGVIEVQLEFSDDLILLENGAGSEIVILDSNQDPVNNGCALVDGRVATAKADIDKAGTYRVGWRVVSGDGHPISGSFEFEIVNAQGYVADANYVFRDCANPYDKETSQIDLPTPSYLYWLLWGSIPLVSLGPFLWLRPRKKELLGKSEAQEQKPE